MVSILLRCFTDFHSHLEDIFSITLQVVIACGDQAMMRIAQSYQVWPKTTGGVRFSRQHGRVSNRVAQMVAGQGGSKRSLFRKWVGEFLPKLGIETIITKKSVSQRSATGGTLRSALTKVAECASDQVRRSDQLTTPLNTHAPILSPTCKKN